MSEYGIPSTGDLRYEPYDAMDSSAPAAGKPGIPKEVVYAYRHYQERPALVVANAVVTGLTLTLVPCFGSQRIDLTVALRDDQGREIWRKAYSDKITRSVWMPWIIHLFSKQSMFREPTMLRDMMLNVFRHAAADLTAARVTGQGASSVPYAGQTGTRQGGR